jgi:hypothetical protein
MPFRELYDTKADGIVFEEVFANAKTILNRFRGRGNVHGCIRPMANAPHRNLR